MPWGNDLDSVRKKLDNFDFKNAKDAVEQLQGIDDASAQEMITKYTEQYLKLKNKIESEMQAGFQNLQAAAEKWKGMPEETDDEKKEKYLAGTDLNSDFVKAQLHINNWGNLWPELDLGKNFYINKTFPLINPIETKLFKELERYVNL